MLIATEQGRNGLVDVAMKMSLQFGFSVSFWITLHKKIQVILLT